MTRSDTACRGPARRRRNTGRLRRVRCGKKLSAMPSSQRHPRGSCHEYDEPPAQHRPPQGRRTDRRQRPHGDRGHAKPRGRGDCGGHAESCCSEHRLRLRASRRSSHREEGDPLFDDTSPWPFSEERRGLARPRETPLRKTRGDAGGVALPLRLLLRSGNRPMPETANWADPGAGSGAFRSSVAANGILLISASTTQPPPRSRPSSAGNPASTTSWTTTPAPVREWLPAYAEAVDAKKPRSGCPRALHAGSWNGVPR